MTINSHTSLYGVFGNPVSHSLSPLMHNGAFLHCGINSAYLAFRITDIAAAVSSIKTLGIQGVSITIPHKIAVMEHLDQIDEKALKIGAVNTIVNRNGKLEGYNSDGLGAIAALKEKTAISDKRVAIIGAGGAARAIGEGIVSAGGKLTIVNRSISRGETLAADFDAAFLPLAEFSEPAFDILINTTPLGMTPDVQSMPVPAEVLTREMVVMDIVYNPLKTRLLKVAGQIGCKTVDGVAMFVYQGAFQFELWTGRNAPVDIMRQTVINALRHE